MQSGFKEDAQVRGWLRTVWSPMFVLLLKSAYVIYTSVCDSFASDKNVNGIYELCEGVKQQGGSLEEYYSYVKRRWEELGLYQPYPEDIDTWQRLREQGVIKAPIPYRCRPSFLECYFLKTFLYFIVGSLTTLLSTLPCILPQLE